jgi:predicted glycoside hydrolase/deacetylase ChbG (UPF0249 family)
MNVIINADDFGSTERHTRCILQLLDLGKISSTTFLVNLPYSAVAAKQLREQYSQHIDKVGLHFNLTEGKPLNPKLAHSPFVDGAGNLKDFRRRVSAWQQLRHLRQLMQELELQIEQFQTLVGKYPSHIDSHGHTHCTWIMLLALLFSKTASKVKAVRLTRQYDHEPHLTSGIKQKIRRWAKKALNFAFRLKFQTTDYFTDIRNMDGTWLRPDDLTFIQAKFRNVEIMCHPYYLDESEYDCLKPSPNLFEHASNIKLLSYTEFTQRK